MRFPVAIKILALLNIIYVLLSFFLFKINLISIHFVENHLSASLVGLYIGIACTCIFLMLVAALVWIFELKASYSFLILNVLAATLFTVLVVPTGTVSDQKFINDTFGIMLIGGFIILATSFVLLLTPFSKAWLMEKGRINYYRFHPAMTTCLFLAMVVTAFCGINFKAPLPDSENMEVVSAVDIASPVEETAAQESDEDGDNVDTESSKLSDTEFISFYENLYSIKWLSVLKKEFYCFGNENEPPVISLKGEKLGMFNCTQSALEDLALENNEHWHSLKHLIEQSEPEPVAPEAKLFYKLLPINFYQDIPESRFRYVNPSSVKWIYEHLIPDPEAEIEGNKAKEIYNVVFRNFFRSMVIYHQQITQTRKIDYEARLYLDAVEKQQTLAWLDERYGTEPPADKGIDSTERQKPGMFISFWLRRYIDTSEAELWKGLTLLMQSYDAQWWSENHQVH